MTFDYDICGEGGIPSALIGHKNIAGNAAAQYVQRGSAMAISKGGIELIAAETMTRTRAETRLTTNPVNTFVSAPEMTMGKNCREVVVEDAPWTLWKLCDEF